MSRISEYDWYTRYDDRKLKEEPWDRLGGLSCREFMIKVSEEWNKPIFGQNFYGVIAGKETKELVEVGCNVIFSDCGFISEYEEIV